MQFLWSHEFLTPGLACFLGMLLGVCVGDPCLRQKVEPLNLSSSIWLRVQETRFHPLLCQATAEWCWGSHLFSMSFCKMGFPCPCPLFLRASLQSSHEKTSGEREMEKLKPLSPCRVSFWFSPLWMSQTAANLQSPASCSLALLTFHPLESFVQ